MGSAVVGSMASTREGLGRRSVSRHKEICEKYQIQYSSQPKMFTKDLPPRHPPFERPPVCLYSPTPPLPRREDWQMTQYRRAPKYPDHVPTYEQSMVAISRRIRNRSLPPLQDHTIPGLNMLGTNYCSVGSTGNPGTRWGTPARWTTSRGSPARGIPARGTPGRGLSAWTHF